MSAREPDSRRGDACSAPKRTGAAVRQRRSRSRRTRGMIMLRVEVHEHSIAEALIVAGRLTDAEALCRGRVERELAKVIQEWASRWNESY
jgi:hypothetical protein